MVKEVYPRPVINIIEAIHLGDPASDRNEFRGRILDAVTENLRLDRALFVLADETSRVRQESSGVDGVLQIPNLSRLFK